MPYFKLASEGGGLIVAVEWPGDWKTSFEWLADGKLRITAGLKRSRFKLRSGEAVRLPSMLVWFEPERAMRGTWLDRERPTWRGTPNELRYMEKDGFCLLDLGNAEARRWALDSISQHIRAAGIAVYRQDFNPLTEWSDDPAKWLAFQFHDCATGEGIVQAFCGKDTTYPPKWVALIRRTTAGHATILAFRVVLRKSSGASDRRQRVENSCRKLQNVVRDSTVKICGVAP